MLLLKKALENNIVIVRGLDINNQLSGKLPNEDNGQGRIIVNLSKDTEQMFKFNRIKLKL